MRITRRLAATAAPITLAVVLAACSGSSGGSSGDSTSGSTGAATYGGVVNEAWPATPNFIFPLTPATNNDGYNENLSMEIWPMLVYAGDGAKSIVNPQESLFTSMTWSNVGERRVPSCEAVTFFMARRSSRHRPSDSHR